MKDGLDEDFAFNLLDGISKEWKFENPGVDESLFEPIRKHLTFDANMFAFEFWTQRNTFRPFFDKYKKFVINYWEDWHAFEQGGIYCVETNGVYFPDEKKSPLITHSTMYGAPLHHSFIRQATSEIERSNPFFNQDIKLVIPVLQHCFPQVQRNLEETLGVPYEIKASFNPVFLDITYVI